MLKTALQKDPKVSQKETAIPVKSKLAKKAPRASIKAVPAAVQSTAWIFPRVSSRIARITPESFSAASPARKTFRTPRPYSTPAKRRPATPFPIASGCTPSITPLRKSAVLLPSFSIAPVLKKPPARANAPEIPPPSFLPSACQSTLSAASPSFSPRSFPAPVKSLFLIMSASFPIVSSIAPVFKTVCFPAREVPLFQPAPPVFSLSRWISSKDSSVARYAFAAPFAFRKPFCSFARSISSFLNVDLPCSAAAN